MMLSRYLKLGLGAAAMLCITGSAAWTTRGAWGAGMLVIAPSQDRVSFEQPRDVRQALAIERPGATIRAWLFEPDAAPRGTVLLLHGIRSNKLPLVGRARDHAQHGLRAIAIDSRGHGESTARYLTYGVEEARDLVALTDELERRELLARPLSVVGTSYGAATALLYAALDARVERVVAIAPFASLREVVPAYLHWKLGPLASLIPPEAVRGMIDGATTDAGFDPSAACPRCVAPSIQARVLLIHSRDDERIPWQHSVAIRNALRLPSELLLLEGPDHVGTGNGPGVAEAIKRFLAGVAVP